jgi:hypothetical protein
VDVEADYARLPLPLAVALRLRDAGASTALIAAALAIDHDGVGPLLEIAQSKLERLRS